ncbi:MAG: MFS transporter [Rhodospirillales bacterium CG15_BIG_FIL_POST_REV_8_21_14_020_66_15]|nr:MAG: MFS transporter [Rhodospirillales bacterium CG15_BIG_FIL_POST_REV_8_21_14_020_66_15]
MGAAIERLTGIPLRQQWPAWMVGLGHGGTHWVIAVYYLMVPWLRQDLGISYTEAGLILTSFHLFSFIANFGSGAAVDLVGRRVFLQVISLVIGAAALAAMKWAGGFWSVFVLLAFIGATNNLWHPPAISYLSSAYPEKKGYALSLHALGASVGDAIAPLAAGFLLVWLGWRDASTVASIPVFIIALLLLLTLNAREKAANAAANKEKLTRTDYLGGIRDLFRNKAVVTLCAMSGFRTVTLMGLLMFLPLYLADEMRMAPTAVGATLMAMQIGGLIATPMAGIWSDRSGRRPVVMAGFTGTTLVLAVITLLDNQMLLVAGVSLLGFSLYAARPVMHSWMMDITPPHLSGSSMSLLFGTQSAFNFALPPLCGLIADTWGLTAVFYLLAGTILVANLMVFLVPEESKSAA